MAKIDDLRNSIPLFESYKNRPFMGPAAFWDQRIEEVRQQIRDEENRINASNQLQVMQEQIAKRMAEEQERLKQEAIEAQKRREGEEKQFQSTRTQVQELRDDLINQAQNYRANLAGTQQEIFNPFANDVRRQLSTAMGKQKEELSKRGLLYSGARSGGEANLRNEASSQLANQRALVNQQTEATAKGLDDMGTQATQDLANLDMMQAGARQSGADQAYQAALARRSNALAGIESQNQLKNMGSDLAQGWYDYNRGTKNLDYERQQGGTNYLPMVVGGLGTIAGAGMGIANANRNYPQTQATSTKVDSSSFAPIVDSPRVASNRVSYNPNAMTGQTPSKNLRNV